MSTTATAMPRLTVQGDSEDKFFEGLVKSWIRSQAAKGHDFRHTGISVIAGWFKQPDISWSEDAGIMTIEFTSALRNHQNAIEGEMAEEIRANL